MTESDESRPDGDGGDADRLDEDLPRRTYLKAAVAVGGTAGLSACLGELSGEDTPEPIPTGDGPDANPDRQHAWNEFVRRDDDGNTLLPRHQVLLYCNLPGEGPPSTETRETVRAALDDLDRAFAWSHEGLLHSVGYSPAYFDRFEAALPESIDLPRPEPLSAFETPTFDEQDLLVHLASDRPDALLQAEEALRGNRETANGTTVQPITEAVEVDDRRTGFVGAGLPRERAEGLEGVPDDNPVPERSPLFMGFTAGFAGNQASESSVTIRRGPFAGGTTKSVGNWRQRLADWYEEQSFEERVMELFSPQHAERDLVEGVGENLGSDSGIDQFLDDLPAVAEQFGRIGHAQKAARANRDEEGNVRLLRRHFESTDGDVASLHFPSLQRGITAFEEVRKAMNGTDVTDATPAVRQRVNNGILEYIFVRNRGYFLVPPRSLRALPTPDGAAG
ncbi:MAG: Tat pathway signal protein [Halobaculum sp.]